MSKILITGDAGFIGFHLTSELLRRGHSVLGLDSITEYYDPELKLARLRQLDGAERYTHVTADINDGPRLRGIVSDYRPEIVVHLAAQAGVRYSLEAPRTYIETNVVGTFNLLEALREFAPDHLMLASTSSVYGGNLRFPFEETAPTDYPMSLYASTKRATESMAHSYSHLWRTPTTVFRFFTVYGPWGRPDMALFKFVRAIEAGEHIDIYGNGRMRRDFTYVDDLVSAVAALAFTPPSSDPVGAADSLSPVAPFRIVNVGGGRPVELMAFVKAVESALGLEASKRYLEMQPGDVVETFADTQLLQQLIGYVPHTPVSVGVQRFVDWYHQYAE